MLYLNKNFPVENRKIQGKPLTCLILKAKHDNEIIIPIPRSFRDNNYLEKGLYENLCITFTKNCKPRIDFSPKKSEEKNIFCILDTEGEEVITSGNIYIEYEQYRCNEIDRILSITRKENDNNYLESAIVKIPNNKKVRYIKIEYSDGKTSYILSNMNKIYEIDSEDCYFSEEDYKLKFDLGLSDLRKLEDLDNLKNSDNEFDKELYEFIINNRR